MIEILFIFGVILILGFIYFKAPIISFLARNGILKSNTSATSSSPPAGFSGFVDSVLSVLKNKTANVDNVPLGNTGGGAGSARSFVAL